MARIGILGGTFDPPHVGHLILAEYAADALDLTRVLFVPAADPPHKREEHKTPVEQRIRMLQLAVDGNPRFSISRVDADRPGPHYSVDMIRLIQAENPGDELYFLMGGDSLNNLPQWYQPDVLIKLCKLAVMARAGSTTLPDMHTTVLPELAERLIILDTPMIEISSTQITERLALGKSVRYLVPDSVLAYIQSCHLYES
ncbi:MAG: nicotinate-nucleotide adenylyltransferase [Anaerolineae bacterium]|nr:nicotinate-nucleotide adenylyltransferase [Anaerolineae bacterium]